MNPTNFDIADLFTGASYPKDEVTVTLDSGIAYKLSKAQADAYEATSKDDDSLKEKVEKEIKALLKEGESRSVTFHLTGVSREMRMALEDIVNEKYPSEADFLGREKANPEKAEYFENKWWELHIEKMVRPDGSEIVKPSEADIKVFRGNAPDPSIASVATAIKGLAEGVKNGIDALSVERDFLSQP